jgi:hypothetical protein
MALALLLEKGAAGYIDPIYEVDRLSFLYVFLFGLLLALWSVLHLWDRRSRGAESAIVRAGVGGAGALVAFVILWAVYPQFLSEPWFPVDELYHRVRSVNIGESQPVLSGGTFGREGILNVLIRVLVWIGNGFPALLFLGYLVVRRESRNQAFWVYLAVALAIILAFAVLRHGLVFRDMRALSLFLILPFAELTAWIVERLEGLRWRALIRPLIVISLIVWPIMLGAGLKKMSGPADASVTGCSVTPMAKYLGAEAPWRDEPLRIMAFVDYGPVILYRTHHSIFSYPNHRYQSGFTDTYRAMTATEEEEARAILERRRVDLLLICDSPVTANFYRTDHGKPTFWQRLAGREAPDWLISVPLPEELDGDFRLYRYPHGESGE